MEFKGTMLLPIVAKELPVDIGTEWNLKFCMPGCRICPRRRVDIGTEWNLKYSG